MKRSVKYKLLKDGEHKVGTDIDIVRILRDHRWLMAGMKALLQQQSVEFTDSVRREAKLRLLDKVIDNA